MRKKIQTKEFIRHKFAEYYQQSESVKPPSLLEKREFAFLLLEEGVMRRAEDLTFQKRVLDREIMEAIENGYFDFEYRPNP